MSRAKATPRRAKTAKRTRTAPKRETGATAQRTGAQTAPKIVMQRRKRSTLFREGEPYWAVVRTKAGRENYARLNLERQGFEVYLPRCCPTGRGKLEPVFRTYLFVRIIDQWVKIESTFGVSGIVKTEERPVKVHPQVIKNLKRLENSDGVVVFETQRKLIQGERLKVVKGAFVGHIMLYDGSTAEGRVKALYEFLGNQLTIEFNRSYVVPAGALHAPVTGEVKTSTGAVASQERTNKKDAAPPLAPQTHTPTKRPRKTNAKVL
jgi:transcription antitermination factor NusG